MPLKKNGNILNDSKPRAKSATGYDVAENWDEPLFIGAQTG